jgi:hypothetical protein
MTYQLVKHDPKQNRHDSEPFRALKKRDLGG